MDGIFFSLSFYLSNKILKRNVLPVELHKFLIIIFELKNYVNILLVQLWVVICNYLNRLVSLFCIFSSLHLMSVLSALTYTSNMFWHNMFS